MKNDKLIQIGSLVSSSFCDLKNTGITTVYLQEMYLCDSLWILTWVFWNWLAFIQVCSYLVKHFHATIHQHQSNPYITLPNIINILENPPKLKHLHCVASWCRCKITGYTWALTWTLWDSWPPPHPTWSRIWAPRLSQPAYLPCLQDSRCEANTIPVTTCIFKSFAKDLYKPWPLLSWLSAIIIGCGSMRDHT